MNQTTINWDIATNEQAQRKTRGQQNRATMMQEFLDSKCDMFSSLDFYYYAGETWAPVEELIKLAKFDCPIETLLENAQIDNDNKLIDLLADNLIN